MINEREMVIISKETGRGLINYHSKVVDAYSLRCRIKEITEDEIKIVSDEAEGSVFTIYPDDLELIHENELYFGDILFLNALVCKDYIDHYTIFFWFTVNEADQKMIKYIEKRNFKKVDEKIYDMEGDIL